MRSLTGFVLLPILALMAGPAAAESSVTRFVCVFDRHVTPDLGIVVSSENPVKLELVVDATGHAFAVGRNVYPVRVHTGDKGVTFLEELITGVVQSTTVQLDGRAVHSRHTIILGELVPSQYYGTCE